MRHDLGSVTSADIWATGLKGKSPFFWYSRKLRWDDQLRRKGMCFHTAKAKGLWMG